MTCMLSLKMALATSRCSLPPRHTHEHACTSLVPTPLHEVRRHRGRCLHVQPASNAPNKSGSGVGPSISPSSVPVSSVSPTQLLHKVEFAAIAVAAVCQAAVLVSTAVCQWQQTRQLAELQDQLHSMGREGAAEIDADLGSTVHTLEQQPLPQQQSQQYHVAVHPSQQPAAPATGLHLVTNSALVVGLLCGAGLRQLQLRHPLQLSASALKPSADAAVRLAAVEVAAQQVSTQLIATARQMDKLQARVRLATSDLKQPIKAVQGAAAQQAAALLKLSEQQVALQRQVDGSQELIAALQGLAAKQFKVSAEALQQLKQGQSQLSTSTHKAVEELQRQHRSLQKLVQSQQRQMRALEQSMVTLQQQQPSWQQPAAGDSSATADSTAGKQDVMPPDPWKTQPPAAHVDGIGLRSKGAAGVSAPETPNNSSRNGHVLPSPESEHSLNGSQQPAASAV